MNIKLIAALFLVHLILSCNNDNEAIVYSGESVEKIVVNHRQKEDIADFSNDFSVKTITLKDRDYGTITQTFILNDGGAIISEGKTDRVRRVDINGHILWELSPGDGPGKYIKFSSISLGPDQNNIYVNSDFYQYTYDIEGNFIERKSPGFNYTECHVANREGAMWHVSNVFNNSHLFPDNKSSYELYYKSGENIFGFIPMPEKEKPNMFVDHSDLTSFGKDLFYHRSFSDTIYKVNSKSPEVAPYLVVGFENIPSFANVMQDEKPTALHRYVHEQSMPFLKHCVPHEKGTLMVYYDGTAHTLAKVGLDKIVELQSRLLLIDDGIYKAPYFFSNGSFSYVAFDYEQEYLQQLKEQKQINKDWQLELEQIKNNKGDLADLQLVFLTITP